MKLLILVIFTLTTLSCKTTENKIARVDQHQKFVEVQSNNDNKSAMMSPKNSDKYIDTTKEMRKKLRTATTKSPF